MTTTYDLARFEARAEALAEAVAALESHRNTRRTEISIRHATEALRIVRELHADANATLARAELGDQPPLTAFERAGARDETDRWRGR